MKKILKILQAFTFLHIDKAAIILYYETTLNDVVNEKPKVTTSLFPFSTKAPY